ncbi:MAG: hypothetical protein KC657_13355 [Myxococcales bacterium]|nr:hypothetical protein [Myxococcales bacterium]
MGDGSRVVVAVLVTLAGCAPLPMVRTIRARPPPGPSLAELAGRARPDPRLDAFELAATKLEDALAEAGERCPTGVASVEEGSPRERTPVRCTSRRRRSGASRERRCEASGPPEQVSVYRARCLARGAVGTTRVTTRAPESDEVPPLCAAP